MCTAQGKRTTLQSSTSSRVTGRAKAAVVAAAVEAVKRGGPWWPWCWLRPQIFWAGSTTNAVSEGTFKEIVKTMRGDRRIL